VQRPLATVVIGGLVSATLLTLFVLPALYARIGVKVDEKTELVERGPFRWVRNPFFSSMLVSVGGMVLLLPNVVAIAAFASMFIAAELQVRFVEEPYLLGTHGERYASYTQRAGRFVPGHGKGLALPKGPR
jgi:protein-S-isoprenylcysteine O-methyltransferase Ste14